MISLNLLLVAFFKPEEMRPRSSGAALQEKLHTTQQDSIYRLVDPVIAAANGMPQKSPDTRLAALSIEQGDHLWFPFDISANYKKLEAV